MYYDRAVVAAADADTATRIHPSGEDQRWNPKRRAWETGEWYYTGNDWPGLIADDTDLPAGVVCASGKGYG